MSQTLRERIAEIVAEYANQDGLTKYEAVDAILAAVKSVVPPKDGFKHVEDAFGWAECRQAMLERLEDKGA